MNTDTNDIEIWKVIEEYPRYSISNYGRVLSTAQGKRKILKPYQNEKGYLIVRLANKPKKKGEYDRKDIKVHRLVAKYFCGGYAEDKEVHHKNLCRSDNRASNLICITAEEHKKLHKKLRQQETNINPAAFSIDENKGE